MGQGTHSTFQCAKFTAVAVALCLILAVLRWTENESASTMHEARESLSFLQTKSSASSIATQIKSCPKELLEVYEDCKTVELQVDIKLGQEIVRARQGHSVMVYTAVDSAKLPQAPRSVVGWKPVIQVTRSTCPGKQESSALIHHINVYALPSKSPLKPGRHYTDRDIDTSKLEGGFMVASHDREAGEYILPQDYGIPADDPMYMEHHLLFPECWSFDEEVHEKSRLDLYVTSQSLKPAGFVGALNFDMNVKPGQGRVDYVTRASAKSLKKIFPKFASTALSPDAELPEILAVHLHTHDIAHRKFFEVLDPDGSVSFRSEEENAGYGLQEQSFASPVAKGWGQLWLRPGQSLQQHCIMDTEHLEHSVTYGLDWGQEMCAPLLIVGGIDPHGIPSAISVRNGFVILLGRQLRAMLVDLAHEIQRLTLP